METLLQYIWRNRLFPAQGLSTSQGETIEIIETGSFTDSDQQPTFIHAKIRINGMLWAGSVQVEEKASDWEQHRTQKTSAFQNVILLVTGQDDCTPLHTTGGDIPMTVIPCTNEGLRQFNLLKAGSAYPFCGEAFAALPDKSREDTLDSLLFQRLYNRQAQIAGRINLYNNNWEEAFFCTLARNFGFGYSGDSFEAWIQNIPLQYAAKHRDNLFQVEALFLGQAGLLDISTVPAYYQKNAQEDRYLKRLQTEYNYLSHKFELHPIDVAIWRGGQGSSTPHLRIARLAAIYHYGVVTLSRILETATVTELRRLLNTLPSEYWVRHTIFGGTQTDGIRNMSNKSLDLLLINTVAPFVFAYGKHRSEESYCRFALDILRQLNPEDNYIVRHWENCGIHPLDAAQAQALIQLKKACCDTKCCLQCPVGCSYMKSVLGLASRK